jgi:hypothetical protein
VERGASPFTALVQMARQTGTKISNFRFQKICSLYIAFQDLRHHWQHTSAHVSIRQHTSAYVSIHQHTSAYLDHSLARVPLLLLQLPIASCQTPPRPEREPPPPHQHWAEGDARVARAEARYRAISLCLSLSHPLSLARSLAGARALAV